jgi:hypothetical protein
VKAGNPYEQSPVTEAASTPQIYTLRNDQGKTCLEVAVNRQTK